MTESNKLLNYSALTILNLYNGVETTRTIVIIGVERGGTSMVAGVLRALGLFLGDRTGRNHENPEFQTEDRNTLLNKIESMNAKYDVWGVKYPRASLMVPFYNQHLRNPYFILVARNITSVVDSWCSRGANDPIETARHALEYYTAALNSVKDSGRPAVLVNYEKACCYPDDFVSDMAEFTGIEPTQDQWLNATRMITGEGGGYLNIPEHNFYIGSDSIPGDAHRLPAIKKAVSFIGKVEETDRVVAGLSCFLIDRTLLPESFYVEISIDFELLDCEIRAYVNFGGGFFSRHSYPLRLDSASSCYRFDTSGKVEAFCIACPSQKVIESMNIELFSRCF